MMRSLRPALSSLRVQRDNASAPRRNEDLMYQAVTVAAIVGLLASVWVF